MILTWPQDAPRGAVTRFVAEHQISRSQFYALRARAVAEGPLEAMWPRPRRLRGQRHPQAIPLEVEELAVQIRKQLADQGWDHGPVTVREELRRAGVAAPAASTLARLFTRRGMVTPQPRKRPRASYRRFEFSLVHECWQLDAFEWHLADDRPCAVFQVLDDCTRYLLASRAAPGERAEDAIAVVSKAIAEFQVPRLLLSDNGVAFNRERLGHRTQLVAMLKTLGCHPITGRPRHPQTQGKDERVHATVQRWLRARPPATDLAELQALLEEFDHHYNHRRAHQALQMQTPAHALATRVHAIAPRPPEPAAQAAPNDEIKILTRRVGTTGQISIKGAYVNLGMAHTATQVAVLLTENTASIFDHQGTHIRSLTLVPGQRYYSNGRPRGAPSHKRPH